MNLIYDSKSVGENQVFIDEKSRFLRKLDSSWCKNRVDSNDLEFLKYLPLITSEAYPLVCETENSKGSLVHNMRKDGITSYAAHPMNAVNIALRFGFFDLVFLTSLALHDIKEEQEAFRKKLIKYGYGENFSDSYAISDLLRENIFPMIDQICFNRGIVLPDNFYREVERSVDIYTPSGDKQKDLESLCFENGTYFGKCFDNMSVSRDPEGVVMPYLGDFNMIESKLNKRVKNTSDLVAIGQAKIDCARSSKYLSTLRTLEDCRDFLIDFRGLVLNYPGNLTKDVMRKIKYETQDMHPVYSNIVYAYNTQG